MATIIRKFDGAQFSGSVILDLEPSIAYPASVLAAYRLRKSADYSAKPKAGAWPSLSMVDSGADVTFTPYSAQSNAGKSLGINGRQMPTGSLSMLVVSRQRSIAGSGTLQWLGGSAVSGSAAYGMVRSKDTLNTALNINGTNYAAMTADGGDRWEAIFGTFDHSALQAKLYRPRTGSTTAAAIPSAPTPPSSAIRALGNNIYTAPVEGALIAFFSGVLSQAEMDSIYASAKASLTVSGIQI